MNSATLPKSLVDPDAVGVRLTTEEVDALPAGTILIWPHNQAVWRRSLAAERSSRGWSALGLDQGYPSSHVAAFPVLIVWGRPTPPPAPSEPWSVISTDRDKPTDAWITYEVGDEDHRYLGQWWQDGDNLYRVQDNAKWALGVTRVELLHTHNPETHVPVERALINEAARALVWLDDVRSPGSRDIDFRDVRGIVIALASLASDESGASDGGQS